MRYRFEYNGNPEYVTLHTTVKLTEDSFVSDTVLSDSSSKEMLTVLKGTLGAVEVTLRPYSVSFKRGAAFDREEVLQAGLEMLVMYLRSVGSLAEGEELVKGTAIRSDVGAMMCPECRAIQNAEMKQFAEDVLDW